MTDATGLRKRVVALEAHLRSMPSQLMAYKADVKALQAENAALAERLKASEEDANALAENLAGCKYDEVAEQNTRLTADLAAAREQIELHHTANMQTMEWWEQAKQSNTYLKAALEMAAHRLRQLEQMDTRAYAAVKPALTSS